MRYQNLLRERDQLVAEGKTIFEAAEKASRDLTEAEKTRDDEINARLEALGADIQREETRRAREAATPAVAAAVTAVHDRAADDPMWGFRNAADFGRSVMAACRPGAQVDERLLAAQRFGAAPTSYHQETGGSSGEGYMTPPAMRTEIWDAVYNSDEPDLINLITAEPTESNTVELLADETTPWGSTGIQAAWRSEGIQMTPSKLSLQGRQVRLETLYAFVLATDELLADAPRLNDRLTRGAARAIKWKASEAIFLGTGAGLPRGFFSTGAPFVSVAKESAQVASTVVAANVAKMLARLLGTRGVWLHNPDALPQIMTMTLGQQPIWTPPSTGFTQAPNGFLFGKALMPNEHCATVGTQSDLVLFNPDGYYATQKAGEGVRADSSIHLYFDYGVTAFRWTFRLGGQPFLSAAVSPKNGSATRSHFVVLDTRS